MQKLILFFLFLPLAVIAQKDYASLLNNYMQAQANVNQFTGTVLVAQKGKIIYEKAFGMADREWRTPNILQSKFEIGSITKQFTAAAILQLTTQGKINLDDKLSKYVAGFTRGDSITIHMLLNHTSGLQDYEFDPQFAILAQSQLLTNNTRYLNDTLVNYFKKNAYDFRAGTDWKYSNTGYFLLGYIIEKLTGQPYGDYVLHNVIQKAGLQNTLVNQWDSIIPYRAKGYAKIGEQWKNASHLSMEIPYSAGNMLSTVEDLYAWNNALFGGKVISTDMLHKMTTPYMGHYGYALFIDTFQHHFRLWHSGGIPGFGSFIARYPADDLVVVGLSNNENASTGNMMDALAGILLGIPVTPPYIHIEAKMDSAYLDSYIGNYVVGSSDPFQIIKKDGKLFRHKPESDIELKPESNTKFFYADGSDRQIEFKVDKSGKVVTAFFIYSGIKEEMKRL